MAWLWLLIGAVWTVNLVLWIKNAVTDVKLEKDYKFSVFMALTSTTWVILSVCTTLERLGVIK